MACRTQQNQSCYHLDRYCCWQHSFLPCIQKRTPSMEVVELCIWYVVGAIVRIVWISTVTIQLSRSETAIDSTNSSSTDQFCRSEWPPISCELDAVPPCTRPCGHHRRRRDSNAASDNPCCSSRMPCSLGNTCAYRPQERRHIHRTNR